MDYTPTTQRPFEEDAQKMKVSMASHQVDTTVMGGVPTPKHDDLAAMQANDYILRARDGAVTRVPVERSLIPHDPLGFAQLMTVLKGPNDTIYVLQTSIASKSTDGGRTWTVLESDEKLRHANGENGAGQTQVLRDGTFVTVVEAVAKEPDLAEVWASSDEGQTFEKISRIPVPQMYAEYPNHGSGNFAMVRLPDDTLLWITHAWNVEYEGRYEKYLSGKSMAVAFSSTDRGLTWEGPFWIADWVSEGGMARMASGKLLVAVRHNRPLLPGDSPELTRRNWNNGITAFKHVMLVDSHDCGRTWTNHRLLTTMFGQCYGFPAGLGNGMAVVLHDHRYPRGQSHPLRSMVSHDEGLTWENEVYYLFFADKGTGYGSSVVLDDDTVLTIGGITDPDAGEGSSGSVGHCSLATVRWKPMKD